MSAGPISRRDALLTGAALLLGVPAAALAKSGEGPKISVFGIGGPSSPFNAGIPTGGKVQYKENGEAEIAVFRRIISESKTRLEGAVPSLKAKYWEDIRSTLRLEMTGLRPTVLKINSTLDDTTSKKATKAYLVLKNDLENLDQACIQKNQNKAFKAYNASLKSFSAWQDVVGY